MLHGAPLAPLLRHNGAVNTAEFSPDGRLLVTAGNDGIAKVWDLSTAQRPVKPADPPSAVLPDTAKPERWTSRDGTRLVTVERGFAAQVRDAVTNQAIGEPLQHGNAVIFADFGPENRVVITGSGDDTARIWDAVTGADHATVAAQRHRHVRGDQSGRSAGHHGIHRPLGPHLGRPHRRAGHAAVAA